MAWWQYYSQQKKSIKDGDDFNDDFDDDGYDYENDNHDVASCATSCGKHMAWQQYDIQQKKLIRGAHWTKDKEEMNDGINVGQTELYLKQTNKHINK